jgi:uncharacterized protein YraI
MLKKRHACCILILCTAVLGCNPPSNPDMRNLAATVSALSATQNALAAGAPSAAASATATGTGAPSATVAASATPCTPLATASKDANVRSGPGVVYDPPVGNLATGQTAPIAGKSSDGTWWYINFSNAPGGFGWIAASTVAATCVPPSLAVVAAPPTPLVVAVTNVSVSVSPATITVDGCKGTIKPLTVSATIEVNGAMKLTLYFVTQQDGSLPNQTINIPKAGSQVVSDTFRHPPPLAAGTYWVTLLIDGQDLSSLDAQATYDISC